MKTWGVCFFQNKEGLSHHENHHDVGNIYVYIYMTQLFVQYFGSGGFKFYICLFLDKVGAHVFPCMVRSCHGDCCSQPSEITRINGRKLMRETPAVSKPYTGLYL